MKLNSILKNILIEETTKGIPSITTDYAISNNFFGPVYHGTTEDNRENIKNNGFFVVDDSNTKYKRNGYQTSNYHDSVPAPIHHLGYGVYFTTKKSIAKKYNENSSRGLTEYYLNVPRLKIINFGSEKTMMKWWIENGYTFPPINDFRNKNIEQMRIEYTRKLTNELKSKYDAVWFKGHGIRRLLDGDQICVYEPEGKIFKIDDSNVGGLQIGATVTVKDIDTVLKLKNEFYRKINPNIEITIREKTPYGIITSDNSFIPYDDKNYGKIIGRYENTKNGLTYFKVKFKKGGTVFEPANILVPKNL